MGELLRFELDGGGAVLVEVADDEPGIEQAARVDELVVKARVSLEQALDQVRAVANAAVARLRDLAEQPQQIQVEFGIRLNAEAGAVIARTQAEGHLQVTLTWTRAERAGP
jgi:Trypsin-co-occurring domain 1